jgi:hypothetical protein
MVLATYAEALFSSGRCKEALAAQEQAVEAISSWAGHNRDYEDSLAKFEETCGTD